MKDSSRETSKATGKGTRGVLIGRTRVGNQTTAATSGAPSGQQERHRKFSTSDGNFPREIAREQWQDFLADFSAEHDGWNSDIEVFEPNQTSRLEVHGLPFEGVSIDLQQRVTAISAGDKTSDHVQKLIPATNRITALNENEMEIEALDRTRILVHCHEPTTRAE
ncbi:MAG TPA: DUF5335 family protein [Verrucomicrobiae bacterium]|nr:DUF5335 family protein [Verrucomicrobiae bacterium]